MALRDRYGPHIIRTGAAFGALSAAAVTGRPTLSTGSLSFDLLTGGLPRGALTELAGPDGSGKGTLALAALAACQRGDGLALLVDADGAVDPDSLVAVGVDLERLLLACPTTAAEGWDLLLALCRTGALHLVVLASLPGLLTLPGAAATLRPSPLSWRLARLQGALRGRDTALLVTTDPEATVVRAAMGHAALAQAATLRLALERCALRYGPHGDVIALRSRARVVKHHGLPRPPAFLLDMTPTGPRRAAELVTLGLLTGCLDETAVGLALDDRLLGRTPERAAATLEAAPDLAAALLQRVHAAWSSSETTEWECGGVAR